MNDNLKPNKPGYYWWEDKKGESHIVYFMYNMINILFDAMSNCTVEKFETRFIFKRWLGPAYPPKTEGV